MTDQGRTTKPQELPADGATLAFDALRHAVEELARNIDSDMATIRRGLEAAFDRYDGLASPADYGNHFERMADDMVLIAEHVKALEISPALRYGPDDYGRMFEVIADRVIVNLHRAKLGGSDIESVTRELRELVYAARDRNRQDRRLLTAGLAGLLLGGLLTWTVVRVWQSLSF
jgi:hypothetical protein